MRILITGAAGFIGMHTALRLLARGDDVIGLDNLNNYYDVRLKEARLAQLERVPGYHHIACDVCDEAALSAAFARWQPEKVIHLAAQVGVRYSLVNPAAYIQGNLVGFGKILEACRNHRIAHLVYASSSSVYGGSLELPFSETDNVDHPVSLYAATKKANELMAHCYSHLYNLPTTGLRFFTVYGPWGRPDMAPMLFAKAILNDMPIDVFNNGDMLRDFTYVDDIVEGMSRVLDKPPNADNDESGQRTVPYKVFNIGNNQPVQLNEFIDVLENTIGRKARRVLRPMQAGDVRATCANTEALEQWVDFRPLTSIATGVRNLVAWYLTFNRMS